MGAGVEFGNLSLELRYYSVRNVQGANVVWNAEMTRLAVIAGYKLVPTKG